MSPNYAVRSALLFVVTLAFPFAALSQQLPAGVTVGPDGTVYIGGDITKEEFDKINNYLGGTAEDGTITTDKVCDALMKQVPGWGTRTLADIGSFFGACPSSSDLIKTLLEDRVFPGLKEKCEGLSGSYRTTFSANGCDIPGWRVVECKFEEPTVPHTCAGLRELCEKTEVGGGMSPPDSSGPGQLYGSFRYPGCVCTSYNRYEEVACEGPITGPKNSAADSSSGQLE